ncbi:hypothetical protein [Terrarubrum flagellatum]|uniref:hypothetical protein n=1 Tax=Terrirubrum flagellatum TaxID=2895980 RepID=UPI00314505BA
MTSPTQQALQSLRSARMFLDQEAAAIDDSVALNNALKQSLLCVIEALSAIATGQRATYMLLEEVQKLLQQPRFTRP